MKILNIAVFAFAAVALLTATVQLTAATPDYPYCPEWCEGGRCLSHEPCWEWCNGEKTNSFCDVICGNPC